MKKSWHKIADQVWEDIRLENLSGNFDNEHFKLPLDFYVARLQSKWPGMASSITHKTAINYFSRIRSGQTEVERDADSSEWHENWIKKMIKRSEHRRL